MQIYNFDGELSIADLDKQYMGEALKLAGYAQNEGEVPIGAIVVCKGKIIGKGYNLTERLQDVTAHAEMQALTAAAGYLGCKYLQDCTLYVTIEPCVMCTGAAYWSQLKRVVYGADDPKRGSFLIGNLYHPKTEVVKGVLEEECGGLLTSFFRNKRNSL